MLIHFLSRILKIQLCNKRLIFASECRLWQFFANKCACDEISLRFMVFSWFNGMTHVLWGVGISFGGVADGLAISRNILIIAWVRLVIRVIIWIKIGGIGVAPINMNPRLNVKSVRFIHYFKVRKRLFWNHVEESRIEFLCEWHY